MIEVALLSELRELKKKLIKINNENIVLFFVKGQVYALKSECPHAMGQLNEGEINDLEIICPKHNYAFDLETGECTNMPGYFVRKFNVKLDGEKIFIEF